MKSCSTLNRLAGSLDGERPHLSDRGVWSTSSSELNSPPWPQSDDTSTDEVEGLRSTSVPSKITSSAGGVGTTVMLLVAWSFSSNGDRR